MKMRHHERGDHQQRTAGDRHALFPADPHSASLLKRRRRVV
jgi:hypothetical protein